jgi:hypothetical protein
LNRRRLVWTALAFAFCRSGRAQAAPSYPSISREDLTTFSLYQGLFQETVSSQRIADQFKAQGADDRGARHQMKAVASLTDAEEAALIGAAVPCMESVTANLRSINNLLVQFRSKATVTTPYPPALVQQVTGLKNKNIATVFAAIQRLQDAFGPARFRNLDRYVRTAIADRLKKSGISLTPPALPARP